LRIPIPRSTTCAGINREVWKIDEKPHKGDREGSGAAALLHRPAARRLSLRRCRTGQRLAASRELA
jgi:hypothetical protein